MENALGRPFCNDAYTHLSVSKDQQMGFATFLES